MPRVANTIHERLTSGQLVRPLFCPICGAIVRVPVKRRINGSTLPETHRLPDHESGNGANMCAAVTVTVKLAFDKCGKCGKNYGKHPSGLCLRCFTRKTPKGRERGAAQAASP